MRTRLLVLAVVAVLGTAAFAADPKSPSALTVPDFQVTDIFGSASNLTDFAPEGKWLLFYVRANNRPSEIMLSELKADKYASSFDRIVFVVGGIDAAEFQQWIKKFPDLANARWYLDPKREAFAKLDLHGVPVEMGIDGKKIEWRLSGMGSPSTFDSTLLTWTRQ